MKAQFILKILLLVFLLCIIGVYLYFENNTLELSYYEVVDSKVGEEFDEFKIIQISDFHNTSSNKLQNSLIKNIKDEKPDIIVITGDFVDSRRTDVDISINFLKEIIDVAPIYYVSGNHESRIDEYVILKEEMLKLNVKILENEMDVIEKDGAFLELIGINDPAFSDNYDSISDEEIINEYLEDTLQVSGNFKILLSHRPEVFTTYVDNNIDLVFTGHAHGGQIVIPFIGPIFVPSEGFFPEYTSGMHTKDDTTMIISRGIGNSSFPFRINNNPELVVLTLKNK